MAYYRSYRNYPLYQKKVKTYKDYLHLSYPENVKRVKYYKDRIKLINDFLNKKEKYENDLDAYNKEHLDKIFKYKYINTYKDKKYIELSNSADEFYIKAKKKIGWGILMSRDEKLNLQYEYDEKKKLVRNREDEIAKMEEQKENEYKKMHPPPKVPKIKWERSGNDGYFKSDHFIDNSDDVYKLKRSRDRMLEILPHLLKAQEIVKKKYDKQQNEIKSAKDETAKHKAHSYAYLEKTRELALEVKREIKSQLSKFKVCPYCENDLGEIPHADHIYPVSKGGLSTKENMVYICQNCNSTKSDKTLNAFIKLKGFDRDKIEANLELLGKDY